MRSQYNTNKLTAAEYEVIKAYIDGCNTQPEIAMKLGLQVSTVKYHVLRTIEKLEVKSVIHAVLKVFPPSENPKLEFINLNCKPHGRTKMKFEQFKKLKELAK